MARAGCMRVGYHDTDRACPTMQSVAAPPWKPGFGALNGFAAVSTRQFFPTLAQQAGSFFIARNNPHILIDYEHWGIERV